MFYDYKLLFSLLQVDPHSGTSQRPRLGHPITLNSTLPVTAFTSPSPTANCPCLINPLVPSIGSRMKKCPELLTGAEALSSVLLQQ